MAALWPAPSAQVWEAPRRRLTLLLKTRPRLVATPWFKSIPSAPRVRVTGEAPAMSTEAGVPPLTRIPPQTVDAEKDSVAARVEPLFQTATSLESGKEPEDQADGSFSEMSVSARVTFSAWRGAVARAAKAAPKRATAEGETRNGRELSEECMDGAGADVAGLGKARRKERTGRKAGRRDYGGKGKRHEVCAGGGTNGLGEEMSLLRLVQ